MSIIKPHHFLYSLPKIIKNPSKVLSDKRLLADTVPIVTLLAPVGPLAFSPIVVSLEAKKKKADRNEQRKMLRNELISQALTVVIHMFSFLVGGYMVRRILPRLKPDYFKVGSNALNNAQTTGCMLGAFFGLTFIRPFLTIKAVKDQDHKTPQPSPKKALQKSDQTSLTQPTSIWAYPQFSNN